MKKVVLAAAAVALAAPATAVAKEVTKLRVCGASGCAAITDRSTLARIGEGSNGEQLSRTPPLQPYYRLDYTIKGDRRTAFTSFYVPRARVTRGLNQGGYAQWFPVSSVFARAIAKLGVTPFRKPKVVRVLVGDRTVDDPASYARLLSLRAPLAPVSAATDWQTIAFEFRRPNPWSRDANILEFSPSTGYLYRDSRTLDLPDAVAARIRDSASVDSDGGIQLAYLFGGGLGGAALLLGAGLLLRRLSRPTQ